MDDFEFEESVDIPKIEIKWEASTQTPNEILAPKPQEPSKKDGHQNEQSFQAQLKKKRDLNMMQQIIKLKDEIKPMEAESKE